jgi:hypothetical protein
MNLNGGIMRQIIALLISALVLGCVFVQPTAEAKKVRILAAKEVDRCQNLGTLTSRVQHRVGVFARAEESVEEDVTSNAKNAAAERKADTLVPLGEIKNGEQTFGLYRCL